MKRLILFTLLTMLMSLSAFSHAIEVVNSDGVTVYYDYSADGKELSVAFRGSFIVPTTMFLYFENGRLTAIQY